MATALHSDRFLGLEQGTGDRPESSMPVTYDSTPDLEVGARVFAGTERARPARLADGARVAPPRARDGATCVTKAGQGCAVSAKLCAAEPSQARWVSCTLFAAEPAAVRHLPLCRAVK